MNKKYLIFLFLAIVGIALFAFYNYTTAEGGFMVDQWQTQVDGLTAYDTPEGENWFTKAIQNGIFYVLINIGKGLLFLTQNLLDYVMSDSFITVSFTDNAIVRAGLDITRNLGNIIIILASVIIALATILRVKEYQAQKTIPILIGVALLINFAPMICGVVIDGSNITMSYFRDMGGLSPILYENIDEGMNIMMTKTLSGQQRLGQGIALTVFALFTSITFLLYAILFAFRYIALWLLVIFAPLAFACYILKFTRKFFTQWWNQFLQWSIIGIPAMFILFLTNVMLTALKEQSLTSATQNTDLTGFTVIFQYFMPVIFLIGGFFMTLQTGAAGASIVTGFFDKQVKAGSKKAGAFIADKTVVAGTKGAKKALREPISGIGDWMKKEKGEEGGETGETADREALEKQKGEISGFTYNSRRIGQFLGHAVRGIPGVRSIGRNLASGSDESNREEIKNKQKESEGKSLSYQGKAINSVQALSRIAGLLAAIKDKNVKGLMDQGLLDKGQIKRIMKDAIRIYPSAMGEMKKAISPKLVEEAVNDSGTVPKLNFKEAGVDLSEDDIHKRKWTLKDKLYATARAKNMEEWDSDTLKEYGASAVAQSASTQQFAAAVKAGGPEFIDIYNKKSIEMATEAGDIAKGEKDEENIKSGLRKYYKENNKPLGAYRENTAAQNLGASIDTISIKKIEETDDQTKKKEEEKKTEEKQKSSTKNHVKTDINAKGKKIDDSKKDNTNDNVHTDINAKGKKIEK